MFDLRWDDLTVSEKEQATETYLCIRECEEGRTRNEVSEEYPLPIDANGVMNCTFFRNENGYIEVDV